MVESDRQRLPPTRQHDQKNSQGTVESLGVGVKGVRDGERGGGEGSKSGARTVVRKGEGMKRGTMGLPPSIESDLSYHAMLGQHIRAVLPDSRNLSPEALMKLGVPGKEVLELGRAKEEKKKRAGGVEAKGLRESREELKPFKRQSYHVAIAYHIYLKQIKSSENPSVHAIDPTYNARRLREQSNKPQ